MEPRDLKERLPKLDKFLHDRKGLVKVYEESLLSGSVRDDRIDSFLYSIYSCHLEIIKAQYSLGYPLAELHSPLEVAISAFTKVKGNSWRPSAARSTYFDHLSLFSLALLLEVDDVHWKLLVGKWQEIDEADRIIDLLIKSRNTDHVLSDTCIHEKHFGHALDIYASVNDAEAVCALREYLKKWYVKFRGGSWYDSHDRPNEIGYFGYWSFEAAAIAKIKNLPLENTKLGQYFPYSFFSLPEQIKKAPKPRVRKGYQRVSAPDFERFSIEIPKEYRKINTEHLRIESSDELLALDCTIRIAKRESLEFFAKNFHSRLNEEHPWLSSVSELEEVKVGKVNGLKKAYLSAPHRDREQTIFEHYIFSFKAYFIELQFRYANIHTDAYKNNICDIVKSVRLR